MFYISKNQLVTLLCSTIAFNAFAMESKLEKVVIDNPSQLQDAPAFTNIITSLSANNQFGCLFHVPKHKAALFKAILEEKTRKLGIAFTVISPDQAQEFVQHRMALNATDGMFYEVAGKSAQHLQRLANECQAENGIQVLLLENKEELTLRKKELDALQTYKNLDLHINDKTHQRAAIFKGAKNCAINTLGGCAIGILFGLMFEFIIYHRGAV